ncbi:MAG: proline--tRNA ligase [Chloroflexi bacterium RBG_16_56_11]|nr:MAG: proline--tRNA ligase [Chloroflexi bacterium RBG_16_56_11]
MRISKLLGKTLREIPADADTVSHRLLVRAGLVNQLAAGVYSYLPLAWRVLKKIEDIVREEMDKAGGQEVSLPVLQPLEMWQSSGRHQALGKVLFTLYDRRERPLALGPTHEEVITQLVSRNVQSYRDLPLLPYQIQTKFRDEPRPRGGLVRAREFIMKDAYSFDIDEAGMDASYDGMVRAYQAIYDRCGLPTMLVEADSGAIGGKDSREFMLVTDSGEDEIIYCPDCKYAANAEKAASIKEKVDDSRPGPLEEVATPGMATIEEVAGFLKIPHNHTLKAVFYVADGHLVFVVIRGDLAVNEIKLNNLLRAADLRLATEAEVVAAGIVAGAASPVGLKGFKVIADDSVTSGANFVAGGNKPDMHLRNVNYSRDFAADTVADIALARAGDRCPRCGGRLASTRGIEVGHVFKLLTRYSEKFNASFIDEKGDSRPIVMGCYGLGISRLLSAVVEHHHDDKGIIWPVSVAPYQVYLCPLYREGSNVPEVAEKLYQELRAAGLEVLFDDREESPGVKFNDADLLGIPFRVTVSPRTLQKDSVELKKRSEKESELVPLTDIIGKIQAMVP